MDLPSLNGISFCTGIGGIELGLKRALGKRYRTVCYVEGETHAAAVLAARMQDGALCNAPIWSDLKTFDPRPWCGIVDLISAGYPCQPFSDAGKRRGEEDPRHLWPYILRHVEAIRPSIVFCENVAGHLSLGFEKVRRDVQSLGYKVEAGIFSAVEIGAPHVRKRLFFIAYADSVRELQPQRCVSNKRRRVGDFCENVSYARGQRCQGGRQQRQSEPQIATSEGGGSDVANALSKRPYGWDGETSQRAWPNPLRPKRCGDDVANPDSLRCNEGRPGSILFERRHSTDGGGDDSQRNVADSLSIDSQRWARETCDESKRWRFSRQKCLAPSDQSWWEAEPYVGRVADGVSHRVDRLRALGNAVVPAVAENAWRHLTARITSSHVSLPNEV